MLHKNVLNAFSNVPVAFGNLPLVNNSNQNQNPAGLSLVQGAPHGPAIPGPANPRLAAPREMGARVAAEPSSLIDLVVISSRRCSSFFAEAAVLVLVFGILDYFMLKGRIELPWIVGALGISLGLLCASIAMDFGAQRWIRAHP